MAILTRDFLILSQTTTACPINSWEELGNKRKKITYHDDDDIKPVPRTREIWRDAEADDFE